MSRHDDAITLGQMFDHIEEAVALAKDRTRAELESARLFFLALLKLALGDRDGGLSATGPPDQGATAGAATMTPETICK